MRTVSTLLATLALLAGLAAASPAVALEETTTEPQSVDYVLSNQQAASTEGTWSATRYADYVSAYDVAQGSAEVSKYRYNVRFPGIDDLNRSRQNCRVVVDDVVLDETRCHRMISSRGLSSSLTFRSGNYIVETIQEDGTSAPVASWTLTLPDEAPPPLAPASCVLYKGKVVKVNSKAIIFEIPDNGKCTDGSMLIEVLSADGNRGMSAPATRVKGNFYRLSDSISTDPMTVFVNGTASPVFISAGLVDDFVGPKFKVKAPKRP